MLNKTVDQLIDDYVSNMDMKACESIIYGNVDNLKYDLRNHEDWENRNDSNNTISKKIPLLIQLGIKKGVIFVKDRETLFYCCNPMDAFSKFLKHVKCENECSWKNAIEKYDIDIKNRINEELYQIIQNKVDLVDLEEYTSFLSEENFSDEEYIKTLCEHFNEIAPELKEAYYQLISYTFFIKAGNKEYNCLSKLVRNYLAENLYKKKECMKIYIKSLITESKNIHLNELSNIIVNENSALNIDCVMKDSFMNNKEWLQRFIPQRRCFTYNDFVCVDNQMIKDIMSVLHNNGDYMKEEEIKEAIEIQKKLYDFENYEGSTKVIAVDDDNIDELRDKYSDGLHFVIGDTHKCWEMLEELLKKIKYDKEKDYIYFLGDYCGGDSNRNIDDLLKYLSHNFEPNYSKPGFHLILGNHEYKERRLLQLPDIMVIRMNKHNFYMAHAAFYSKVIDVIFADMKQNEDQTVFSYKFDDSISSNAEKGTEMYKCWRMKWSTKGTFVPENDEFIQDTRNSADKKACIIHGHTPFFYFEDNSNEKKYGNNSLFWQNQKIWFSEDMQSFNIDSNIKGEKDDRRALSCLCLEVFDEMDVITKKNILRCPNGVFSVEYQNIIKNCQEESNTSKLEDNVFGCKNITVDGNELIIEPNMVLSKDKAKLF